MVSYVVNYHCFVGRFITAARPAAMADISRPTNIVLSTLRSLTPVVIATMFAPM